MASPSELGMREAFAQTTSSRPSAARMPEAAAAVSGTVIAHPDDSRGPRRRAAVLVVVLVCLAVMSMIFVSTIRLATAQRKMIRNNVWQIQAMLLVESGLERAAWRLAADADYTGETWTLPAEELGGTEQAIVRIEVATIADAPDQRLVRVQADYPDHPQYRCRRSQQLTVRLTQENGEET